MKSTITLTLDIDHEGNIPTAIDYAIEVAGHLTRGDVRTRARVESAAIERAGAPVQNVRRFFTRGRV